MTTQEFIERNWGKVPAKSKWCSSVVQDTEGNFYSYGSHYPLLFKVAGTTFINTAGYSSTTGRHILWAQRAVNYNYTAVELNHEDARVISSSWASENDKLQVLARATAEMVADAEVACDSKKRKDTQVFEQLAATLERARRSYQTVNELRS